MTVQNTGKKSTDVTPLSVGVIIGRFQVQDLHEALKKLIEQVLVKHERTIIILGLAPTRSTQNNPLDYETRKKMILAEYPKIEVAYIKDSNNDLVWSKKLDETVKHLLKANQTVTLYGGQDSVITRYQGEYPTIVLESDTIVSSSELKKQVSAQVKASVEFRAGVFYAAADRYPTGFATVDIAIFNDNGTKLLLGRKPEETKYRFIGGYNDPGTATFEGDAQREAEEETSLVTSTPIYLGSTRIDDWRYRNEQDKIKTLFFAAKKLSGSPKAQDDIAEITWLPWDVVAATYKESVVAEHQPLVEMLIKARKTTDLEQKLGFVPKNLGLIVKLTNALLAEVKTISALNPADPRLPSLIDLLEEARTTYPGDHQ